MFKLQYCYCCYNTVIMYNIVKIIRNGQFVLRIELNEPKKDKICVL